MHPPIFIWLASSHLLENTGKASTLSCGSPAGHSADGALVVPDDDGDDDSSEGTDSSIYMLFQNIHKKTIGKGYWKPNMNKWKFIAKTLLSRVWAFTTTFIIVTTSITTIVIIWNLLLHAVGNADCCDVGSHARIWCSLVNHNDNDKMINENNHDNDFMISENPH